MAAKKKVTRKAPAKKPAAKKKGTGSARKPAAPAKRKAAPRAAKPTASRKKAPAGRARKAAPRTSKRPPVRAARPARRANVKATGKPLRENREALELARLIAGAALDKKALDVVVLDTRLRGPLVGYDYVVLATGESDRQLEAIAQAAEEVAWGRRRKPTNVEVGPEWVLTNFDDVVAHFFTPDKRALYDLEGLWSDAPRVTLG